MYTYVYTGSSGSTRPPDIYICMSTYKYIQIHIHKRRQQAHHERLLRRGAAAAHDRRIYTYVCLHTNTYKYIYTQKTSAGAP